MSKLDKADERGIVGIAEKINFLENSPESLRFEIFEDFKSDLDSCNERLSSEIDKEEKANIEAEMYGVKRELVDALNDPVSYFKKLYQDGHLDDEYVKYLKTHHGIELKK